MNINGIINVYKEKGYTSFDVVAILRGIIGIRKIGHTGTLDPDATGVLPVCLGKGTKVVGFLTNKKKSYRAVFETGYTTDTQDISGSVIKRFEGITSLEQVKEELEKFVGDYQQTPPMYSALKYNGKKLYELARKGITIKREPRLVVIHKIEQIQQIDETHFSFEVTCSKGTYVRTLIYDLGLILNVGATLSELERTAVEPFMLKDALTLDEIRKLESINELSNYIHKIDSIFYSYGELIVSTNYDKALYNGNELPISLINSKYDKIDLDLRIRVYDSHKQFIGIYKTVLRKDVMILKIEKMFY